MSEPDRQELLRALAEELNLEAHGMVRLPGLMQLNCFTKADPYLVVYLTIFDNGNSQIIIGWSRVKAIELEDPASIELTRKHIEDECAAALLVTEDQRRKRVRWG